jgi:hypothetical protein
MAHRRGAAALGDEAVDIARGGTCHIAGLSMGGNVAAWLAGASDVDAPCSSRRSLACEGVAANDAGAGRGLLACPDFTVWWDDQ